MCVLKDVFFKESKYLFFKRFNKWYVIFKIGYSIIKLILKLYVYYKWININVMNNFFEELINIIKLYLCNFFGLVIIVVLFICM